MLIDSYFMGMNVLLYVCLCTTCVPGSYGDKKVYLELELWVARAALKVTNCGSPARAASDHQCWSCLHSPLSLCLKIEKTLCNDWAFLIMSEIMEISSESAFMTHHEWVCPSNWRLALIRLHCQACGRWYCLYILNMQPLYLTKLKHTLGWVIPLFGFSPCKL